MKKVPVGIVGATGMIGQHYLHLLRDHPWFEVTFLAASQSGPQEEQLHPKWQLSSSIPSISLTVDHIEEIEKAQKKCSLIFSALPNELAASVEERYAKAGLPVISSASFHRMNPAIPLMIPEINPDHLAILSYQQKKQGWEKGFIITKPNCAIQAFVLPLTPLHREFQIKRLSITTLQAISGAGLKGLHAFNIHDNVIPYIPAEEEKVEKEPLKIWGSLTENGIQSTSQMALSAHCNRVPVLEGHLACVSVEFEKKPTAEQIEKAWQEFSSPLSLPSLPKNPLIYRPEQDRPQPRLDREAEKGMAVTIGRLRPCSLFDYRFTALSHNTLRGGAAGGVAIAELLFQRGLL